MSSPRLGLFVLADVAAGGQNGHECGSRKGLEGRTTEAAFCYRGVCDIGGLTMMADAKEAAYRSYRDVVEEAIALWLQDQPGPITTPIDPRAMGDLSLRITRALEEAWLIEPAAVHILPASTDF